MSVCDRGEKGSKIIKNSVTYFMDGPKDDLASIGRMTFNRKDDLQ